MPRGTRRNKALHDAPKNRSDAVNPQEFNVSIKNVTEQENPGLANPNAPLLDAKMIHPEFQTMPSLDAEKMRKIEALRFNEELVTVDILDTDDENADHAFVIEVCGEKQVFSRGGRFTVRRKFVEGLARAKPVSYAQGTKNQNGELTADSYRGRRGEKYPFQVFHDPNPNGKEWLQQIRSQP